MIAAAAVGLGMSADPAWAAPPIPDSGTLTWSITNGGPTPAGVTPSATIEFAPETLAAPVDTVYATLDATVPAGTSAEVAVRGLLPDGTWTAWTAITEDASATLGTETTSVQTRLVLTAANGTAGPQVREIDLVGWAG
ncbi:hypothetical protein CFN78_00645 [Amycolatopsis antarctica]|uniref:Uncharacterized protein n=1 Tax=Amycolatopsis antarctica TaxID=1854586 RepID=A0A263D8E0_9PSEU|nr:hypothetical protein CFN78_00645 [Amycolatopsis antarctica]